MIPTATALLRNVEALERFATAYGVSLPDDVGEARKSALQIARDARLRPAFDMRAAARAAVGADVSKSVKSLAKDAQADAAEREAMSALVEATAEHAASVAYAATYGVVEAALSGPEMKKAAKDLADILAATGGHLPTVANPEDYSAVILHARLREVEQVAERLVSRAQALPGVGFDVAFPVLLLMDPAPALTNHTAIAVRAATRGINGSNDIGAWQADPGSAVPTFRPISPTAPASLLLALRGASVSLAPSFDEVDRRHALVSTGNDAVTLSETDSNWFLA